MKSPRKVQRAKIPRYTESLDAAIPGEKIVSVCFDESTSKWIAINQSKTGRLYIGVGNTEPLARRIAGLQALQKRGLSTTHNENTALRDLIVALDHLTDAVKKTTSTLQSSPTIRSGELLNLRV